MSSPQPDAPAVARVVIVPSAGDTGQLDYAVDASLTAAVQAGVRVLVPLGARRALGVVTYLATTSPHPRLKKILTVLDSAPLLDGALMRLCQWMAAYYLCSFGEAVSAALPGSLRITLERVASVIAHPAPDPEDTLREHRGNREASAHRSRGTSDQSGNLQTAFTPGEEALLSWLTTNGPQSTDALADKFGAHGRRALLALQRKGVIRIDEDLRGGDGATKHERYYRAARQLAADEALEWRRKRPAQFAVYAYLHDHPLHRARPMELHATFPNLSPKLGALLKAGLIAVDEEEVYRPVLSDAPQNDRPVDLTEAQRAAVDAVTRSLGREFRGYLLWGVTGSGKTEVYLRCIALCLAEGRTALVLVPEISLTHQLVARVRARFGNRVAVLHSGLSDGERWDEWRRIARGEVAIVVGARSAVFAPLPRLGIVVVDEEHDAAFKQEDGIRYNGRDCAVMRAKLAGCRGRSG